MKGPHENLDDLNACPQRQLELVGVTLVTETEVDQAFIQAETPDVLVLACGGMRDSIGFESTAGTQIVPIDQILFADMGENVTIVGSNCQAVDCALWLQAHGKNVTMVTTDPKDYVAKGQSYHVKAFELPMLYARGMRLWPTASIVSVGDGEIAVIGESSLEETFPCDTVLDALDLLPNTGLADGCGVTEVHSVVDCAAPFNIQDTIAFAHLMARNI